MKKIWLDAGHGGKDPGAVANGLLEKELVLKMQGYMIDYLRIHYEGFLIEATRTKDVFETLQGRARRANAWEADVFMSLHINAGGGTGFESFVYSQPSQASVALQNVVNQAALATAKKYGLGVHGGVANKRANYSVLRETAMPAILMETAYIDSKDTALLKNNQFLRDMSEAYACGLAKFLGLKPKTQVQNVVNGKKYRLRTGTFNDYTTAERMVAELKQKYGWTVYIEEA
ncbi:N-acetylmuramoyl-L-alanine amidase [Priestia abyssalis]|uniref:N-acetylmuramoyl-L-alanine amidase n=1 Tax=Priestia abyssalis TaxID=1221450 RepID=UPI000994B739|nr:N-acetylmuramoyl-L-alanine amidase [Priestia abyssalis]